VRKLPLCALALLVVAAAVGSAALAAGLRRTAPAVACPAPDVPHADGEWRVAIGVYRSKAQALALVRRAAVLGFKNLGLDQQVGPRYVVSLNGLRTKVQLNEEIAQVKRAKLQVVGVETELSPCR
jgi:hypothetical protein